MTGFPSLTICSQCRSYQIVHNASFRKTSTHRPDRWRVETRYGYREIDAYLNEFGISTPHEWHRWNSKREYSALHLYSKPADTIIKIAEDLGLDSFHSSHGISSPSQNWVDTTRFRLFISHIAKNKDKATRLRHCLVPYEISGFVAHEDINATLEWQLEIERALYTMDAFLATHTKGFKDSYWAQQEVGFALGRGVRLYRSRWTKIRQGLSPNIRRSPV